MTADELATKIWEHISIVAFIGAGGKIKNEEWLRRSLKEFEESVRKDEREKCTSS